jgi:hypothetical protein
MSSVALEKSGVRSRFVIKLSYKVSANKFIFSCCVTAILLFIFKGGILLVPFVRYLVNLYVSCISFEFRIWNVWYKFLRSSFLIACLFVT